MCTAAEPTDHAWSNGSIVLTTASRFHHQGRQVRQEVQVAKTTGAATDRCGTSASRRRRAEILLLHLAAGANEKIRVFRIARPRTDRTTRRRRQPPGQFYGGCQPQQSATDRRQNVYTTATYRGQRAKVSTRVSRRWPSPIRHRWPTRPLRVRTTLTGLGLMDWDWG